MDGIIYVAIICAIIFRLVIMRGSFVLPTFYRRGDEMSFNLGSVSTIIVAIVAALGLMYTSPENFANPIMAFTTTYAAPQIVDGVITFGARNTMSVPDDDEIIDDEIDELEEDFDDEVA